MAGSSKFLGAPNNQVQQNKYLATFTDAEGNAGSEFVMVTPDPATIPIFGVLPSHEKAAQKVKDHLLESRGDYYLRGINENNLTVTFAGHASAEDIARRGNIMARATNAPVKKGE